jgi:hypothetical protein
MKTVEGVKLDIPNTQIPDRSRSWLDADTLKEVSVLN